MTDPTPILGGNKASSFVQTQAVAVSEAAAVFYMFATEVDMSYLFSVKSAKPLSYRLDCAENYRRSFADDRK